MLRFVFLWTMAATVCSDAAYACSIEISSIESAISRSDRVVVGVVDSVAWNEIDWGDGEVLLVPREATFRIERVLKGDPEPSELRLLFTGELDFCSSWGHDTGVRMVLMLRHWDRVESDSYWAPTIPPWLLYLPADDSYGDTELYQYVEGLATKGVAPISISFYGSTEQLVGQPLDVKVTVSNQMSTRIPVSLNGPKPGTVTNEFHLWLSIEGVSGPPKSFMLDADASRTIDLGEHFDVVSSGHHYIGGDLWLPRSVSNSPSPLHILNYSYTENLSGPFSDIWAYQALETTSVHVHTWGRIKAMVQGAER